METKFSDLVGKTLASVRNQNDEVIEFVTDDATMYQLTHLQDCCESVTVDGITGDLTDLIGVPILVAEEASNRDDPPKSDGAESHTWTFYKLRTIKGSVDVRWYGESNGYYSESVDFIKCE